MHDPRINGDHLSFPRCDHYDAMIEVLLDDRGPATAEADPLLRPPVNLVSQARPIAPTPGGSYTLIHLPEGRRHSMRVGVNTIGRFPENDLVLEPICISRRHCVIVVHTSGRCEVYDTASRNGVYVNCRRIRRAILSPGDLVTLCDDAFLVAWFGPDGGLSPFSGESETLPHDDSFPSN